MYIKKRKKEVLLKKKLVLLSLAGAMILPTAHAFAEENMEANSSINSSQQVEPENFTEYLGWSELESDQEKIKQIQYSSMAYAASNPQHAGWAEYKGEQRRAVGETTWKGVYHYTRARLEGLGLVHHDSGRKWKWHDTRTESPWGHKYWSARTYYGNEK